MFKRFLGIATAMSLVVLSGCSGNSTPSPQPTPADTKAEVNSPEVSETPAAPTSDAEPVTVTVFCSYAGEEPHGQYVYGYADAFMKEHPNVKIEITAVSSNDIVTKLTAMAANPKDLPTLFYTGGDQAPSLYDLGFMEDLNSYLDKDTLASFAPGVVDTATLNNTMAYYPIDVQPLAVLYRTDRFKEAGLEVPATWEEFLTCAQALTTDTKHDGKIDQWGFSMVGSNNSSGQSRFLGYLWSNGLKVVSENDSTGKWETDAASPEFLDAFTFWTDMNNKYAVVPDGITGVDYPTASNYFAMGNTSMMITGSNALGVAYSNNPDLKGKIGSFPIPGGHPGTMLNVEGYALCKNASEEQKTAAVEFLNFFNTNDKDLMFWQSSGKIPATIEGEKADYISGDDYAGYIATIKNGTLPVLNFPGLSGTKTILGDAYSSVFSEEADNKAAVDKLNRSLTELLQDYE